MEPRGHRALATNRHRPPPTPSVSKFKHLLQSRWPAPIHIRATGVSIRHDRRGCDPCARGNEAGQWGTSRGSRTPTGHRRHLPPQGGGLDTGGRSPRTYRSGGAGAWNPFPPPSAASSSRPIVQVEDTMKPSSAKSNSSHLTSSSDEQRPSLPTDDLRHHHHDFERPEADVLEQDMPVFPTPAYFSLDADRVEPIDDADSPYDEHQS